MKLRLFSRHLIGQSPTLAIRQDDRIAGPVTVANWTNGEEGSPDGIAITVQRSTLQVAPDSVRFGVDLSHADFDTPGPEAGSVYDPRLHDLIYIWDTGDSGTWSAPENILPEWNDKSRAKGPWIAHCYTQPGTYTVRVTVIEPSSGKTAQTSTVITIADPDTAYPGTNTICINPPGDTDFTDAPQGARQVTLDPAIHVANDHPWWDATRTSAPQRYLLKGGATYPDPIGFTFGRETGGPHPMFSTYGTGRAVLTPPDTAHNDGRLFWVGPDYDEFDARPANDFRIQNIECRGNFDPTLNLAGEDTESNKAGSMIRTLKYLDLVIQNCHTRGTKNAAIALYMTTGDPTHAGYIHVDDMFITDLGGQYGGIFSAPMDTLPDSAMTLTGLRLTQNPDAISGGSQHRAPIRENGLHKLNIRCSEVFGLDDHNSGWKLMTTPEAEVGHIINLDGVSAEGTFMPLHFQQNATQGIGRSIAANIVVDGMVIIADYTSNKLVESNATGVTLRNILGRVPDSPRFHNDSITSFDFVMNDEESSSPQVRYTSRRIVSGIEFLISGDAPQTVRDARCAVYNCTLAMDRQLEENGSDAGNGAIVFDPTLTHTLSDNNVLIGNWPETQSDPNPYAPLDTTVLWAPRSKGFKGFQSKVLIEEFATPPDAIQSSVPLPGSPALGTALSGKTAFFDIRGAVRPAYPSLGAWEVAGN